MLLVFFDKGIVQREFDPAGLTANFNFYCEFEVLERKCTVKKIGLVETTNGGCCTRTTQLHTPPSKHNSCSKPTVLSGSSPL